MGGLGTETIQLSGGLGGPGSLNVGGFGNAVITGTNTFTGGGSVCCAANLVMTGTLPGPFTVNNSATLGAGGTLGAVTVNAGGSLTPSALATDNFTVSGNLSIGIGGPVAGTQYGTIAVTGTVNVTGGQLSLSGSYAPVAGDVFTIITNDGADPVVGTFASLVTFGGAGPPAPGPPLPEGATFDFNGATLRISYVGGTGNDVTLTTISGAVAGPQPQVPTLSQWALLLLAALVLALGMRASMRKR